MTEELDIKIGTEEEVAWTEIKKKAEKDIKESKRAIIIGEEIIKPPIK
tara:strand:- start:135 stop:278 length:144 start_codon:yes stop_codon:yes gene_type:complete